MVHGIYLKNRPKSKWQLVNVAVSQEIAYQEMEEALKKAHSNGHEEAQVAEQVFESAFWIPHYLAEIKETKPMYN